MCGQGKELVVARTIPNLDKIDGMRSATHAYNHEHEEEGHEGNGAEARTLEKPWKNRIHQLHSLSNYGREPTRQQIGKSLL